MTNSVRALVGALLLAPVVGLLWVGSYTRQTPRLWGFPFFYWYQLAWVVVGALCLAAAYVLTTRGQKR